MSEHIWEDKADEFIEMMDKFVGTNRAITCPNSEPIEWAAALELQKRGYKVKMLQQLGGNGLGFRVYHDDKTT